MSFITLENFTPLVAALIALMGLAFVAAIAAEKLSNVVSKIRQGNYIIAIKLIALSIVFICSLIIIFTIRG